MAEKRIVIKRGISVEQNVEIGNLTLMTILISIRFTYMYLISRKSMDRSRRSNDNTVFTKNFKRVQLSP